MIIGAISRGGSFTSWVGTFKKSQKEKAHIVVKQKPNIRCDAICAPAPQNILECLKCRRCVNVGFRKELIKHVFTKLEFS